jgi:hydrogenase nickel incorporation protein HypA/HybF
MHEMSIAQNILEIVDEYMAREPAAKLLEVVVEIGEMVAVVPDSLNFCYDVLVEDSKYQDSKLIINILPLRGSCISCGHEFKIENYNFNCPSCHSLDLQVQGGQELRITHLEVE